MVLFLLLSDCLETLKWEAVSAPYAGLCARGEADPEDECCALACESERMELMRQAVKITLLVSRSFAPPVRIN